MNSADIAEVMIGEFPRTIPREVFITADHAKLVCRNFLQDGASTRAKRAVTPNRVG
jgi:hypothetical protein